MRGMKVRFTTRWLLFTAFCLAALLTLTLYRPAYILPPVAWLASWAAVVVWCCLFFGDRP
jgi:hypothetical protein